MKNFTAIILSAGRGRRLGELTADKPKGLIRVGEKSLLEHTVDFVRSAGAKEIIVVAGFYADKVKELAVKLGNDIKVVVNPDYTKQNLMSVAKALEHIDRGNILICNVDYIKPANVIEAIQNNNKSLAVFASFENTGNTDEMKIRVNDRGDLVDISKQLIEYDALYSGDFYCAVNYLNEFKEAVRRSLQNNDHDLAVTEHAFLEMRDMGHDIAVINVGPANWLEIDTPEDLAKANETLSKINNLETVACNLCGQKNDEVIYNNDQLTVVICKNCSLAYINPRLSDQGYLDYYQSDYQKKRHDIFDYDQAVKRLEDRKSYAGKKEQLDFFREFLNANSQVLEVGSGWGTLLKRVADEIRCRVKGIEISEQATEVARTYYELDVDNQSLEAYLTDKHNEKYDIVIMHHVLEHFADPKKILEQLQMLIEDDGYLYIAVPNILKPDEPLDRYFRLVHTYYFSPTTINNLLSQVDLKIIKFEIRPQEMRLIAVKQNHPQEALPADMFNAAGAAAAILRAVRNQENKYKTLRQLKLWTARILPPKYFTDIRKVMINILKRLGIIRV